MAGCKVRARDGLAVNGAVHVFSVALLRTHARVSAACMHASLSSTRMRHAPDTALNARPERLPVWYMPMLQRLLLAGGAAVAPRAPHVAV